MNPDPVMVYMGRWIASGSRHLVTKYDLKKRGYLGTTSMDAELSLVMANMAKCRAGTLVSHLKYENALCAYGSDLPFTLK